MHSSAEAEFEGSEAWSFHTFIYSYILCIACSFARDMIRRPQTTDKPSNYFTEASKFC